MYAGIDAGRVVTRLYDIVGEDLKIQKPEIEDGKMKFVGLHFVVKITTRHLGFMEDGNTQHVDGPGEYHCTVEVIIAGRHTFACCTDSPHDERKWEHLSSHATCWRSAVHDFFVKVWFNSCDECQAHMPEDFKHRQAPMNLNSFNCLEFMRAVDVVIEDDKEDQHGYKKKIVSMLGSKKKVGVN